MPTGNIQVKEIELYCAKCGLGLCEHVVVTHRWPCNTPIIRITPCPVCIKSERTDAYEKGHENGYEKGYLDSRPNY
jgi:hypothetical protein